MGLFKRRKAKKELQQENEIRLMIQEELNELMSDDYVQKHLRKIQHDKDKKAKWNNLSNTMKIKLLKYVKEKKGEQKHDNK